MPEISPIDALLLFEAFVASEQQQQQQQPLLLRQAPQAEVQQQSLQTSRQREDNKAENDGVVFYGDDPVTVPGNGIWVTVIPRTPLPPDALPNRLTYRVNGTVVNQRVSENAILTIQVHFAAAATGPSRYATFSYRLPQNRNINNPQRFDWEATFTFTKREDGRVGVVMSERAFRGSARDRTAQRRDWVIPIEIEQLEYTGVTMNLSNSFQLAIYEAIERQIVAS